MKTLVYDMGCGITAFSTGRDADTVAGAGCYDGFNACHYTGDDPVHVDLCRRELIRSVDGIECLVIPRQTHSLNVAVIDREPAGQLVDVDAVVTASRGVAVAVNTADCVPVLLADPDAGVVAAVHSGWRGTVGHIVFKTLESMVALGAVPGRVRAVMGPSICTGCFEVGHEVAEEFEKAFPGVNEVVVYGADAATRPHVGLRQAIRHDLEQAGLHAGNIDTVSSPCSRCNPGEWWSARHIGVNSGRTLSLIMLK